MRRYSEAVKADVRRRMGPLHRQSVAQISQELRTHVITPYKWRKHLRLQAEVVPASQKDPEGWDPADKFTVVLETALAQFSMSADTAVHLRAVAHHRRHIRVAPAGGFPGPDRIGVAQVIGHAALLTLLRLLSSLCRRHLHPGVELGPQLELRLGVTATQLVAAHRPQAFVVVAALHLVPLRIKGLAVLVDELGLMAGSQLRQPLLTIRPSQLIALHPGRR
jgi:hypothetical protein